MEALRPFALLVAISLVAAPDVVAQNQSPPRRAAPAMTASVFLGGVPAGQRTNEVVTISVLDAMNRALEHNLGVSLRLQHRYGEALALYDHVRQIAPTINQVHYNRGTALQHLGRLDGWRGAVADCRRGRRSERCRLVSR